MKIYFNGEVIEEDEAVLPVKDRGTLFGDGLYETIRAYEGNPFRLSRHLDRMREGCRVLKFSGPPEDEEIDKAISRLYELNVGSGDAYIRITVTGGIHDGSKNLERPGSPNVFIFVEPYDGYPPDLYARGMRVIVASVRRNPGSPLSGLKTANYLDTIVAKQEAKDRGADDAILLSTLGNLSEGSSSNLFLVKNGEVRSPDLGSGNLPGITREAVLEICDRLRIPRKVGSLKLEDLLVADEAFLTNAPMEVMPVASVGNRRLGDRCPGPVTADLMEAYRALVREELGL